MPKPTGSRTFEQVLAEIERRITASGLTVGDRLPGERQLAEELQVSRSSVREAFRVLETLGLVEVQVGRGPNAGAILSYDPGATLTDLLRLNLRLSSLTMREVVDTRLMIEQWSAAQAARMPAGHDPESSRAMAAALAAMDGAATPEEFVRHDMAFHIALTDRAGNTLNSAIMRALSITLRQYATEAVHRLGHTADLQTDHRLIHSAITAGSAADAATAVAEHLARAYPPIADGREVLPSSA
ncbi:GntR family transcriptional regulator [Acrocarpospora phusangensis]|uniref:GntR family transcriptional regulator n=1 Tax=Acrocarpospora phusangensis TaxID=1070424 RepID=A0A919URE9_9ACTN|nr:GntR family transcriptional regulator [Acrocarpospora phusangensis]GIH27962.1 GntR family transcriptional regulator [Acrocarpospora phusangensis]